MWQHTSDVMHRKHKALKNAMRISCAIVLILVALFVRGQFVADRLHFKLGANSFTVENGWGMVEFSLAVGDHKTDFGRDASTFAVRYRIERVAQYGMAWLADGNPLGVRIARGTLRTGFPGRRNWAITVDMGLLLLLSGAVPMWWVITRRGRQRGDRILNGHCPTCNYDLRASHDRCPECGEKIRRELHQDPDPRLSI
jgi:hypothetical protein